MEHTCLTVCPWLASSTVPKIEGWNSVKENPDEKQLGPEMIGHKNDSERQRNQNLYLVRSGENR